MYGRLHDIADTEVTIRPAVPRDFTGLRAVFWETAYQTEFESDIESERYEYKYLGWYLEHAAALVFVADQPNPGPATTVLGYICGVRDTADHPDLARLAEHIPLFADQYERFPSHLHINLTASARGKGVGSRLVERLVEAVTLQGSPGIHLVTGDRARNVTFYRRNGFVHEIHRQGALFMGRPITASRLHAGGRQRYS